MGRSVQSPIDKGLVPGGSSGGSASASLAEMGYNVKSFCYQDSPRRAHSIAAQGGINAADTPDTIVYNVTLSNNNTEMEIIIEAGAGVFWTYKLLKQ